MNRYDHPHAKWYATPMLMHLPVALTLGIRTDAPPVLDMWRFLQVAIPTGDKPIINLGDNVVAFPTSPSSSYDLVVSKDGKELRTVKLESNAIQNYSKFSRLRPTGTSIVELDGTGSYTISFQQGSTNLRSYSFQLTPNSGGDAFSPAAGYKISAPWSKFGAILSDPARPTEAAKIGFYCQLQDAGSATPEQLTVTLLKNGTVSAITRPYTLSAKTLQFQESPLYKPNNRDFFTAGDLIKLGTRFEVVVKIGAKVVKRFSGASNGQTLLGVPESNLSYPKIDEILLPKTVEYSGSSDHKAKLLDVYWMINH